MQISVTALSKVYNSKPRLHRAGGLFGIHSTKYALKDINLKIKKGECVGIIGKNGSGKSTLLKLLCQITSPTDGKISVNGKISALLELGTGFNPEYTGISNIYLNGTIQGLTRKETKDLIPAITDFADIGDYINKPVKTYSDGMFLRLAFACAIALKPDILIIDEALAVGDFAFRQKCFAKIEDMMKDGVTIIMVSHDIDAIRRLCPRTVWLDNGILRMDGDTASVSAAYMESMTGAAKLELKSDSNSEIKSCLNRFGSAVGSVVSITLPSALQTGHSYEIICRLNIPQGINLETTALSISFKNSFGLDLTVISSADSEVKFTHHGACTIRICCICYLCPGEYSVCVSLEDRSEKPIKYYDYAEGVQTLRVFSENEYFGSFHTPTKMSVEYGDD